MDDALWLSPSFRAQVYPDLPIASTVAGLLQGGLGGGANSNSTHLGVAPAPLAATPPHTNNKWTIRTVAAQLRSEDQLRELMLETAATSEKETGSCQRADALLLVSGSHPGRRLPGVAR